MFITLRFDCSLATSPSAISASTFNNQLIAKLTLYIIRRLLSQTCSRYLHRANGRLDVAIRMSKSIKHELESSIVPTGGLMLRGQETL